jgi:hypothetical protein
MRYIKFLIACMLIIFPVIACGESGPEISVDETSHDFGDVRVGDVVKTQFSVTNKGDSLLVINDVKTTCGCTGALHGEKEIPPGQKTEISVSYDSSGLSAGRKTQSVIIHSNDPKNPALRLQVFANIIHEISIEPTALFTRLPSFQEHVSFPVTAKNNSKQPVTLDMSGVQGAISKATLQPEKVVVQPNSESRFSIEVDLIKPLDTRVIVGGVSIRTDHPSLSQLPLKCLIKIDQ